MITATVAEQLRDRGWDVVAVVERPGLVGASDDDVLKVAAGEQRLLVTRNVRDFVPLDRTWREAGRSHAGIACLDSSTFPHDRRFVGALVNALNDALSDDALPTPGTCRFLSVRR
jgi:hypothetical protein